MSQWLKIIIPVFLLIVLVQGLAFSDSGKKSLSKDIQQIISNQQEIMTTLEELKEQLRVIKIRVT